MNNLCRNYISRYYICNNIDPYDDIIIKEQPYRNWKLIICITWTTCVNATTGGIGLLVNSREYSYLYNSEIISP